MKIATKELNCPFTPHTFRPDINTTRMVVLCCANAGLGLPLGNDVVQADATSTQIVSPRTQYSFVSAKPASKATEFFVPVNH